jgi:hypothetical protein
LNFGETQPIGDHHPLWMNRIWVLSQTEGDSWLGEAHICSATTILGLKSKFRRFGGLLALHGIVSADVLRGAD